MKSLQRRAVVLAAVVISAIWLAGWACHLLIDSRGLSRDSIMLSGLRADRADALAAEEAAAPVAPDFSQTAPAPAPAPEPMQATPAQASADPSPQTPAPVPAGPTVRRMWMRVTAYCSCAKCCGRWARLGRTASGAPIASNGGQFVAADTHVLSFGTRVRVPGYASGQWVPVLDRGGRIRGNALDLFMPSHAQAKRWGVKWLWVEVQEPGPSDR
ncbi:MAG: Cell wall-binding protein YocH [Phycisphaerae bacterium]|nr:Cell wall-binding protein YocH [Phycisphaerae bacterium]